MEKIELHFSLYNLLVSSFIFISCFNQVLFAQINNSPARAGLRSSVYGFNSFPDTTWWYNASNDMASRFPGASPSVIWILGYTTNDGCYLNFPNPHPDSLYNKIFFGSNDGNEKYLNYFDKKGIKVWLQVEPGFADIITLIDLALSQYQHHPCIIGFGIDVEWYRTSSSNNYEGQGVTDAEAEGWSKKIKSFNEHYLLFTKHWLVEKMPPSFRTDMIFVDDSQIFPDMNSMVSEFTVWAKAFEPARVAFQFGYDSDKKWWSKLSNPPKSIGDELLKRCSNVSDLYWVDFTAYDIWPVDFNPVSVLNEDNLNLPENLILCQNYPNPFNPETIISYQIPGNSSANLSKNNVHVLLKVFDILGNEIAELVNGEKSAGKYNVTFNAAYLSSGIYYYQLTAGNYIQTKKMLLLK